MKKFGNKALDTVVEIVNKIRDAMDFVWHHFEDVKTIMIDIVKLLVAERLAIMATNFGNAIKTLGGGAAAGGEGGLLGLVPGMIKGPALVAMIATWLGQQFDKTFKPPYYDPKSGQYDWSVIDPQGTAMAAEQEKSKNADTAQKSETIKKNMDSAAAATDQIKSAFDQIAQNSAFGLGTTGGGGGGTAWGSGGGGSWGQGVPGGMTGGGGPAFTGALRAEAYGPSQGEFTNATTFGPLGHLQPGDLAISPDLLSQYPIGSYVEVVGPDGQVLRSHRRVADTSWKTANNPNNNTFELWNDQDLGYAKLVASHARGGFVGSKQLSWLAERGPEAVIPLNRSEHSLALLQRTASALGARIGQGHTIAINAPLTVNGVSGADSADFAAALREHAENIVEEIRRVLAVETERMAVI